MKSVRVSADLPGPNAAKVVSVLKKNCYDSTFTYPLVIEDGQGCVIRDVDGNQFLDFTSNIGACPLGYGHPNVMQALAEMTRNGAHKIAGQDFYCVQHAELSERFLSILPDGFKSFFVNTGAEAVENAIKIAYRKRMKDGIPVMPGVSCTGAFHGRTLGALSFTYSKPVQKAGFPELPVLRIKFCKDDLDPEIEIISGVLEQNNVAFVISEVIQGEGGYNVASRKFLENLRKQTDAYGIPLILDEVQSGMGRTGKWWAFEHYGIKPDILSVAKGLQVGAAAFKSDFEPEQRGVLSSTWGGGSRIDMAVGASIIDTVKKDRLLDNASFMGKRLKTGLQELVGKGGLIDVRGIGLMVGMEFDTKERRDAAITNLFRNGLLLLPAGEKAMRAIPPLIITAEEIDEGLEIASAVLR